MPELPEVETTRRGLAAVLTQSVLEQFIVHQPQLRWPVDPDMARYIHGNRLLSCDRRAKYLLLHFEQGTQIVHLGMSGSLRRVSEHETRRPHDHIEWVFNDARFLLHDPRRFGAVLWHPAHLGPATDTHPLLASLGKEPFDASLTASWLRTQFAGKRQAIKQALMDSRIIVGIGNIYASESLFKARINPKRPAGRLSEQRCIRLIAAARDTLNEALTAGGSTLRDYTNASGAPGAYFELHAAVYDREGQPCRHCATPIRRLVQSQRATYYCPLCQRY
ncbi:MAG TPA: bifunctional DNA-formamidopyrimidine glycosylase/DNA-(apurinic or apyrimidinic site) lyase [Burkholderiaceae bacterium]|nr:bifunctional DNA-formamidopyrimidine glycosylase/DNA-(apurinic or apyrimidinic site) lyase [Burkholderiaceae bacterium]